MTSVAQACKIILGNISHLKETEAHKIFFCLGRVSAVSVKANENIPPFNNSAMDGFAVRAQDLMEAGREAPKSLEVIENLPAGYTTQKTIGSMQAIRIMTGATLPKGADSVVMVEDTSSDEGRGTKDEGRGTKDEGRGTKDEGRRTKDEGRKEFVKIFKAVERGENVRYAGEDVKKGEMVIPKGVLLKPGHIGMLASLGIQEIKVFRKPKVAILATGDELVKIKQNLAPGKIRNSNSYSLYAQVLKTGSIPVLLGIAKDKKSELKHKIRKGLSCDMLLISGGVSVGDYDFVKDVLKEVGTQMKFWRVAMKPGKPLAFGMVRKIPVFGLPGNPVSSMISFEQFVRPAILKMSGANEIFRFRLPAIAKEDFVKKKGLRYFLRVVLENKDGQLYASLTGPQGSGILKSMVLANGIMELPEDLEFLKAGQEVEVTYID